MEKILNMQKKYYPIALEEIKKGKKMSHWIWFIFPQIEGLGKSDICKEYEIKSLEEAKDYLNNEYLLDNLKRITRQLLIHKNKNIFDIMGYDYKKLLSSMTLFYFADTDKKCKDLFQEVINTFYNGYMDMSTIKILKEKNNKKLEEEMENLQVYKKKQQKNIKSSTINNQDINNILINRNNIQNINNYKSESDFNSSNSNFNNNN